MNPKPSLSDTVVSEAYARSQWSDWPVTAQAHVRQLLADTCAVAIAGANAEGAAEARELALEWGGQPQASLIGTSQKVPAGSAAFANSVATHALDFDDFLEAGGLHSMTVVFPVCLALAQKHGVADADRLLSAIAAGLEAAARLSIHARRQGMDPGWLPASIFAGIGSVLGGALLAGCSPAQAVSAIGLLYGQLGGNRQALRDGTLAKRMQPAFAARDAVLAVELALRSVTGPPGALDGVHGLFPLYVGGSAPEPYEYRREEPALLLYRVKPYACCAASHPAMDGALSLRQQIDPAEIREVKVHLASRPYKLVGSPFKIRQNPQVDAQFSVAYAVALALGSGSTGMRAFTSAEVLANVSARELASRIEAVEIPDSEALGAWDAETVLDVIMRDGSHHRRRVRGVNAPVAEIVRRKVQDCLLFAGMSSDDATKLLELCTGSEPGLDIDRLVALLEQEVRA